jgi:hypothetical protein
VACVDGQEVERACPLYRLAKARRVEEAALNVKDPALVAGRRGGRGGTSLKHLNVTCLGRKTVSLMASPSSFVLFCCSLLRSGAEGGARAGVAEGTGAGWRGTPSRGGIGSGRGGWRCDSGGGGVRGEGAGLVAVRGAGGDGDLLAGVSGLLSPALVLDVVLAHELLTFCGY